MAETDPSRRSRRSGSARRRNASRLAAVQALYQIDVTGATADSVMSEFVRYRMDARRGDPEMGAADRTHFVDVVRGASQDRPRLDEMLSSSLSQGWSLDRMDKVLCATLRAGAYELWARSDIPARVAISEYVDVASAFFEGREPAFVNGILDQLAHVLRPAEFAGARAKSG